MKPAVIVIDMQKFFLREHPDTFRQKLLPNIAGLLAAVRSRGIPVIHVITRYSSDKSDWPKAWKKRGSIWCLEGSGDERILKETEPLPGEPLIVKTRYNAFYRTDLHRTLRALPADMVVLAGYSSDVCVRMTAMDAYNRGYRLTVLSDCVHSAREDTAVSLRYLAWLTNARVLSSQEFIHGFGSNNREQST